MANPDSTFSRIKGGGIRMMNYGSDCGFGCDSCSSDLPELPLKIQTHDHPAYQPNWNTYQPELSKRDRACTQADELVVAPATVANVPAGYVMHRVYTPPYTVIKGIGVNHTPTVDEYGTSNVSLNGLNYSVVANEVDTTTCPPTIGALVPGAVPAAFASITPATSAETIIGVVSPATGGYVTGAKGVMHSYIINTPPTNNPLSGIKAALTLQVNSETFNALIR
jgi:hypothetical protein